MSQALLELTIRGYVFLNESVSLLQIAGSALVLSGVLIISLNSNREN